MAPVLCGPECVLTPGSPLHESADLILFKTQVIGMLCIGRQPFQAVDGQFPQAAHIFVFCGQNSDGAVLGFTILLKIEKITEILDICIKATGFGKRDGSSVRYQR